MHRNPLTNQNIDERPLKNRCIFLPLEKISSQSSRTKDAAFKMKMRKIEKRHANAFKIVLDFHDNDFYSRKDLECSK